MTSEPHDVPLATVRQAAFEFPPGISQVSLVADAEGDFSLRVFPDHGEPLVYRIETTEQLTEARVMHTLRTCADILTKIVPAGWLARVSAELMAQLRHGHPHRVR